MSNILENSEGREVFRIRDWIAEGKLGRHETFTPRYGWLKKGYDAVVANRNVFNEDDAIITLGVGKNMVRSIRFWCLAFKLLEQNKQKKIVPTKLGKNLLSDNGWDPYLEDDGSLWLLHWQLFIPPFESVSWPLAFNNCNVWDFDIKQLAEIIYSAAQSYPNLAQKSFKTFERDASCLIRMYLDAGNKDSEIECPFSRLGILHKAEEPGFVRFNTASKQNLPTLIFAATCFAYATLHPNVQKTISLYQLAFANNSPGVVFKLSESAVGYYLREAEAELKGFSLVNVLGNMQLHFHDSPSVLYDRALDKYYSER